MGLRIGVIGTGAIGREHIKRFSETIVGCRVTAVSDINKEVAQKVADQYGAEFFETGEELINSDLVDAVVIACWDEEHARYVLASIKAGKYVFCEKPLAVKPEDCLEIMEEEQKFGKRIVQVGFMRRYDPGYQMVKEVIDSGAIGKPLLVHACHRNLTHADNMTSDMSVKNSGIHEIDVTRWLLGEDYEEGHVLYGAQNTLGVEGLADPQIMLLKTKSGVLIDVEVNQSSGYGYDIQCEVVGEKGTVKLPDHSTVVTKLDGKNGLKVEPGWQTRFTEAYDIQFRQWVEDVKADAITGPSSFDGYVACVTADTLGQARVAGKAKEIETVECPEFYK